MGRRGRRVRGDGQALDLDRARVARRALDGRERERSTDHVGAVDDRTGAGGGAASRVRSVQRRRLPRGRVRSAARGRPRVRPPILDRDADRARLVPAVPARGGHLLGAGIEVVPRPRNGGRPHTDPARSVAQHGHEALLAVRGRRLRRRVRDHRVHRLLVRTDVRRESGADVDGVLRGRTAAGRLLRDRPQDRGASGAAQHDGLHPPAVEHLADLGTARTNARDRDRGVALAFRALADGRADPSGVHRSDGRSRRSARRPPRPPTARATWRDRSGLSSARC